MRKDDVKNLFTFSKSERRGAFALSIAIVILLFYNMISPYLFQQDYDFNSFYAEMDELKSSNIVNEKFENEINHESNRIIVEKKLPKLYNFNPNTTSEDEWIKMGLSPKQAKSICKYVRKGGHFFNKEDLKKMYCLNTEECLRLMPFVVISDRVSQPDIVSDFGNETVVDTFKIELNSAIIENLIEVKGIGPATAKGIIKYRRILGGYVNTKQLLEVYQIDSARYKQIVGRFIVRLDSVKRININSATYFDLKRHPYISKSLAYEITQYRSMKGDYKSVEDLKNIKNVSDSLYQKIYLYFAVSENKQ